MTGSEIRILLLSMLYLVANNVYIFKICFRRALIMRKTL